MTFGVSTLAATILFPVLAHIFLGTKGAYIMEGIPKHYHGVLLGLFLASFPLAQFLVGPLMGDYSDKKGRRGIFIYSVLIEAVGYLVCALSIHLGSLLLLFAGRIVTGIAAGNTSVCLATIVDVSASEKEKVKYFGIGSAVIGLMFVMGPLLGGRLSSIFTDPVLTLAMPMWIGGLCAVINFFILLFLFRETIEETCVHPFDVFGSFHNIQQAFRIGQVKDLFLMYFFFLFGWNMIYLFMPAFLVDDYNMSILSVGASGTFFGVIWIAGTLFMQKLARHYHKMHGTLFVCLIAISFLAVISGYVSNIYAFFTSIGLLVFFSGGLWPLFTASISKSAEQGVQGKVLALSQSIQSFSMMLAPLVGGIFLHKHSRMPFVLTAIATLFAAAILVKSGKTPFIFLGDSE